MWRTASSIQADVFAGETGGSDETQPAQCPHMIDTVEINNFRAFKHAKLSDCKKVNVIVGENGSGKTALLEAIFLAAGPSPEIALRLRQWRGAGGTKTEFVGTRQDIEVEIWGDLFHNFETKKAAQVKLQGSAQQNRSVLVSFVPTVQLIPITRRQNVYADGSEPIRFRWKYPGGDTGNITPQFIDGVLKIPPMQDSNVVCSFFAANTSPPMHEAVHRFSKLSRKYEQASFVEAFHQHFRSVKNLSIESSAGAASLFAEVKDLNEKIPLNLVSSGMTKIAAILLTMPAQPNGILLIDEIENGFYYKRLPVIWNTIYDFAKLYNTQLFVSTHSAECLAAVATLAEKHPDDFALLRSVRKGDQTILKQFSGRQFVQALDENIEVR